MKKLYFLDEEEKNRILNIHEGATKRQYLSEQAEYVMPQTTTTSTKPLNVDEQIAKQFYDLGAMGAGTNADEMVNAINKITSAEQFWKVNALVKSRPNNSDKLDIAGVINDEFEYAENAIGTYSNMGDLDKIIKKLKSLGITSTIKDSYGAHTDGTFKITSKPVASTSTPNSNGLSSAAMACVKQYNGVDPKPAKTPGFVYVTTDKATVFFSKDYEVRYRPTGGEIIQGQWSCKGNVLKITTTDGDSYTNGKWAGVPSDKTGDKTGGKTGSKSVSNLTPRVQEIQKSLGIQNPTGQLDVASLQTILSKLNGEVTTPAAGTPAAGTPSAGTPPVAGELTPEQLNATIQQLQANANRPQ